METTKFQRLLSLADAEFVDLAAERLKAGAEKYGPHKFLTVDTLEEAMQEVLDLSNYARMTYIKLYLLKYSLSQIETNVEPDKDGFVSMKEFIQK
jgi:hypothetical protein